MTADNTNENIGQEQTGAGKGRDRKASRKRSPGTKSGRSAAASRRSGESRSASGSSSQAPGAKRGTRSGRGSRGARTGSSAAATRSRSSGRTSSSGSSRAGIVSRAFSGVGRAIPLAARSMPDQRMVQRFADERPYMLGAIGLGIGAMIGLMLPGTLSSISGYASRGRGRGRSRS